MAPRFFTIEEANRLIPRLETLMGRLTEKRQEFLSKQQALEENQAKVQENGHALDRGKIAQLRKELGVLMWGIQQGIAEVEALGCLVKDLDLGLVDFPSLKEGREIYLCWRWGEEEVAFWHGLDEGFAGRKPLKPKIP